MNTLTTVVVTVLAIFIIPLSVCWFATMIVTSRCKTPAEAGVRGLYYLARWLHAIADGANAFVIGYREVMTEVDVDPSCECVRRMAEEKARREGRKHEKRERVKTKQTRQATQDVDAVAKVGLGTRVLKFVFG